MEDIAEEEQEQEQESSSEEEDYWFHCSVDEPVDPSGRSGHDTEAQKWRDSTVIYEFDSSFEREDRRTFHVAVRQIEQATCVRFKEKSEVGDNTYKGPFTVIMKSMNCTRKTCKGGGGVVDYLGETWSLLSIINHVLNPQSQRSVGLLVHELLHVLGLVHTQKRPDRDQFITILEDNIEDSPLARHQYAPCDHCETYGTNYDCMSIMHYRSCTLSAYAGACDLLKYTGRSYKPTMMPADGNSECDLRSLNNTVLTESDIELINTMYCKNEPSASTSASWS